MTPPSLKDIIASAPHRPPTRVPHPLYDELEDAVWLLLEVRPLWNLREAVDYCLAALAETGDHRASRWDAEAVGAAQAEKTLHAIHRTMRYRMRRRREGEVRSQELEVRSRNLGIRI